MPECWERIFVEDEAKAIPIIFCDAVDVVIHHQLSETVIGICLVSGGLYGEIIPVGIWSKDLLLTAEVHFDLDPSKVDGSSYASLLIEAVENLDRVAREAAISEAGHRQFDLTQYPLIIEWIACVDSRAWTLKMRRRTWRS